MKRAAPFLILTIALTLVPHFLNAQLLSDVIFTTQEQIDSFPINNPGLTSIDGRLEIKGDNITNLDSLYVIESINGTLKIWNNPTLTNLAGLQNLQTVGGGINISKNPLLLTLTGLDNIFYLEQGIGIVENESLVSLTGLHNLKECNNMVISANTALENLHGLDSLGIINGFLKIAHNTSMINFEGLNNLRTVGDDFSIGTDFGGNPTLESISALTKLTSIGGFLKIIYNYSLENLNGLENLNSIGHYLEISNNTLLTDISDLKNVTLIDGFIEIIFNNSLTSLQGLENVVADSIWYLDVFLNPSLSDCSVGSICDYLSDSIGESEIVANDPGCNSPEEVLENCELSSGEISFESKLAIYPCPIIDYCRIEYFVHEPGPVTITILSLQGTTIKSFQEYAAYSGYQNYELDFNDLPLGVYFVQLSAGNDSEIRKVVKMKAVSIH